MTVTSINPAQLATVLEGAPDSLKVLSLDCWDTLIWRNVHAPHGVFTELLDDSSALSLRAFAEDTARKRALVRHQRAEITLPEIYEALMPMADAETRAAAIDAEMTAEARHAFAFRPTVELIRDAKRRGMQVVVVSDMYMSSTQLSGLIGAVAGEEVLGLIDRVFCSADHGVTKTSGLFPIVLKAIGATPGQVLHIGDNLKADYESPRALGLYALHLEPFDDEAGQRLRLEAAVSAVIEEPGRAQLPTLQPHRAPIAAMMPLLEDPAARFGYAVMGPVLAGFANWLKVEAQRLRATATGEVRFVFLLRDGHLPRRVYEALAEADGPPVSSIELSRFTAAAAAMTSEEAIFAYVESELTDTRLEVIAKQLLFTPGEVKELIKPPSTGTAKAAFLHKIRKPGALHQIIGRSTAFAERLAGYVRKQTGCQPGDTLALIDLGYAGTVQRFAEPMLKQRLGVQVAGLYLIDRPIEASSSDKRGFMDLRHYDFRTLNAFCTNVAVLEQLCTVAQGSVIDYTADGESVRDELGVKGQQSQVREAIAQAALLFAATSGEAFHRPPASIDETAIRKAAAACMARLMFLPMREEVDVLADFEHDVNLGAKDMLKLFDVASATEGLRRSGLVYLKNTDRMFLPAELRDHGLPLNLTLLTHRRFGLEFRQTDFLHREMVLPIMVAADGDVSLTEVAAHATHDGFYRAIVPIGDSRYAIGVMFGQLFEWVQIEAISFTPVDEWESKAGVKPGKPIPAQTVFEGMSEAAPGLYRCDLETGFGMIPPPPRTSDALMSLTVIFRPIAERRRAAA